MVLTAKRFIGKGWSMGRRITGDELALDILLGEGTREQKDASLAAASKDFSNALRGCVTCPECGHEGPHDHNGDMREYACSGCGLAFEVNP